MSTTNDHQLMLEFQEGDPVAFERLVRRWETTVGRVLLRILGSQCEVEDLRQEVFLKVYGARKRYDRRAAFSTWIHRITLNVARDAVRQRRRRVQRDTRAAREEAAFAVEAPDVSVGRTEVEQSVEGALRSLPEDLREALVLRHWGGLSFSETAQVLGLPTSTVKSRVRVALERLKTELSKRGIDADHSESA